MISPRIRRSLKRELSRSWLAKLGIAIVVALLLVAAFAPLIVPYDPTTQNLDEGQLPPVGFSSAANESVPLQENGSVVFRNGSIVYENRTVYVNSTLDHPLGTNGRGQDILSRVVYGARTSMTVGVVGTLLALLFGVPVGLIAGFYGQRVEDALMRGADIMLAFPSLVLALALVGVWGTASYPIPDPIVASGLSEFVRGSLGMITGMPGTMIVPGTVILVVALVNWVWFARVARGEALSLRNAEYVKAARAAGASDRRLILRHVLPNAITPILVLATIQVAAIILLESSLSFLGFSGTTLSWGRDVSQGREFIQSGQWWIAGMPGLAIVTAVVGLNLVGDWLRDALDPDISGEGGV